MDNGLPIKFRPVKEIILAKTLNHVGLDRSGKCLKTMKKLLRRSNVSPKTDLFGCENVRGKV
jgi:hypothetical protein